jgi:signal peptidase I
MLPNLWIGDFLFANKFHYALHLPFSEVFANRPIYLSSIRPPERGDVVIFSPPEAGQESLYIKRVIGLPGDRIQIQGKHFSINGTPAERIEITGEKRDRLISAPGFDPEDRYKKEKLHLYLETIGNAQYSILEDDSYEGLKSDQDLVIPEDHFFVLGDNRDDTRDSRVFGVISIHSIRAKAFVIWLSYRMTLADSHWSFRPERMGKLVR